jgi:hypothetical protein
MLHKAACRDVWSFLHGNNDCIWDFFSCSGAICWPSIALQHAVTRVSNRSAPRKSSWVVSVVYIAEEGGRVGMDRLRVMNSAEPAAQAALGSC